ncbi:DUF5753 domain-containing protein [Umezawaea sp. Da 62-37]|uniref:DUF5753 domain-containing protein n=1 Tax=Umezawaea sp. Da 62-37 TaxID=3075927 RepID=UPI0028F710CE|nr:DUF5753 domain-containing protein [Umezawaea sp. Da 62-37]WNV83066.1 DUF5753 domain-containing protein [Umezawaea sp. Da 62-37]
MAVRDDGLARRWLVGVELANTRSDAPDAPKQAAVAAALGVSPALISHWEQGKYFPSDEQIRGWYELCRAPRSQADLLVELTTRPEGRSWLSRWNDVVPDRHFLRRYLGLEGFATRVSYYAPMVIPALLQTPEYAAGITGPSARVRPDQEKLLVDLRLHRQERILDGDLRLEAVIEEDVLSRPIGDAATMDGACRRLWELAHLPNCTVRIIPRSVGRHDGLEGRFTLAGFETSTGARQAGPVAYVEIPNDAVYVTKQDHVTAYTRSFESLMAAALSEAESFEAIEARFAV